MNMPQIGSQRRNIAGLLLDPTLNIHSMPPDPTVPTIIHTVSDHHLQPASTAKSSKSQRDKNFPKQRINSSDEISKNSFLPRRRSFCSSQIELGDVFSHNNVKVLSVHMAPFMQIHAVNFARKAYDSLENFTPKALALTLKKEFDGVYGAAWHCIVGSSFGSFVTHSVGGFIYFSMDHKLHVLLFKTSIKRAC